MVRLEHIGIAVRDVATVTRLYETLLGLRPYKHETVEREGVRTHFLAAGTAKLELLEALGPDSPIARHLDKRGEGLHHLAFEVEDAEAALERLRRLGFTPLSDAPRPGADGKRIFFLHPRDTHGVLVEFCESVSAPPAPTPVPVAGSTVDVRCWGRAGNPAVVLLRKDEALARQLEQVCYVLDGTIPDTEALGAVLDFFGVEQAGVLGHGAAAGVALGSAAAEPHRIRRVAVVGAGRPTTAAIPKLAQPVLVGYVAVEDGVALEEVLALHRALPGSALALLPGSGTTLLAPVLRRFFGEVP